MKTAVIIDYIEAGAHHFLISLQKEGANTKQAALIVKKYVETGTITHEEEELLKVHFSDTLKIVGIAVPFVLIPGASIVMPILIKTAKKHNINLLPSIV